MSRSRPMTTDSGNGAGRIFGGSSGIPTNRLAWGRWRFPNCEIPPPHVMPGPLFESRVGKTPDRDETELLVERHASHVRERDPRIRRDIAHRPQRLEENTVHRDSNASAAPLFGYVNRGIDRPTVGGSNVMTAGIRVTDHALLGLGCYPREFSRGTADPLSELISRWWDQFEGDRRVFDDRRVDRGHRAGVVHCCRSNPEGVAHQPIITSCRTPGPL